jgi:hypothetical protein
LGQNRSEFGALRDPWLKQQKPALQVADMLNAFDKTIEVGWCSR